MINELIEISEPEKDDKTIFIWPEGILPDVSQEELIEFKWLFEKHQVEFPQAKQILFYHLY